MSDNLKNWEKMATPPDWAMTPIEGGRLRGKTDINPQWRYKVMTETYGPCGIGWKYEIVRLWTEPGVDGTVFAFALINLWIHTSTEWGEPIPGIGGSMLVEGEKKGLRANDEAFKMAVTDALSVAMKMLGVGSTVYEGRIDGSKYSSRPKNLPSSPPPKPKKKELSEWQNKLFVALQEFCDGDVEDMKATLHSLTEFEKDGTVHPGKTSLYECSDKMCQVAYGKLKAMKEAL